MGEDHKAEIKKDCFAYTKRGNTEKCAALKELYCKKEVCKFYKSKEVFRVEMGESYE